MKIEITLQEAHLKAENLQEMHMSDVIHGFFNVLTGKRKPPEQQRVQMAEPVNIVAPEKKEKNAFDFYQANGFGLLTPHIADKIGRWVDKVGENQVIEAMQLAVRAGIERWSYVEAMLKPMTLQQVDTAITAPLTNIPELQHKEQGIPKSLPKVNGDRRLKVTVAESLEAKEEQEHWNTGIKIEDDGTKRYRCYYWCDCGSKGKRYIYEQDEITTCRECGQELYVETATPNYQENGLPERDKFGNFFIAREVATLNNN